MQILDKACMCGYVCKRERSVCDWVEQIDITEGSLTSFMLHTAYCGISLSHTHTNTQTHCEPQHFSTGQSLQTIHHLSVEVPPQPLQVIELTHAHTLATIHHWNWGTTPEIKPVTLRHIDDRYTHPHTHTYTPTGVPHCLRLLYINKETVAP